jgi:hypothetical protein
MSATWIVLCFAAGAWSQEISFQPRRDFRPAAGMLDPSSFVAADFNGDGKTDLAVANPKLGRIAVLMATDGTLMPGATLPVGVRPERLFTGDFNGDGAVDLLATGEDGFALLSGGTFSAALETRTPEGKQGYAVADFNRDGKTDIVMVRSGVRVLLSRGDGSFEEAQTLAGEGAQVASGDLNGDGRADLVVLAANAAYIHFGDGQGKFRSEKIPYSYPSCTLLSTADLNRDGVDEILTICGALSLHGERLTFETGPLLGDLRYGVSGWGWGASDLVVADWNRDGIPDTATSWVVHWPTYSESGVSVNLGRADGSFSGSINLSDACLAQLAAGDFDGDGRPELA